ncbi:exopolysaccharide transport family protein [Ahrensia sp. 13_GOM-1096m]|uniref:GumC family protein n=1 Tax=Ahrensia sp. 13_GOM-1096m TaxID=1380380 RepID=UPI000685C95C|nr:exopolysaccharide transport family protein [Ahrensia sp. 13_GOM-1096m]
MLYQDAKSIFPNSSLSKDIHTQKEYYTFRDIWLFLKRNTVYFAIGTILGAVIGVAYLIHTPATYVAVARLVMDPGQARIASQDAVSGTIIIESAEIASQVEIVKSESVARSVINELDLLTNPEIQEAKSWRSNIKSWVRIQTDRLGLTEHPNDIPQTEEQLMRRTMAGFLSRVSARRVGQSYVLEVGYTSVDPDLAARSANAIAQTYIRNGMQERSNAAQSGAKWLEERLIEVGQQAREAQVAVEEYRTAKGITPVSTVSSLHQQQLLETSSQLLRTQTETAYERAKLETIKRVIAGDVPDGKIDEAANSALAQKLRDEIRTAKAKLKTLKGRYNASNQAVLSTQDDVMRLESEIQDELQRIEGVYLSNLEVALAKGNIIESDLSDLKFQSVRNNIARVELAELESRATTYRKMYENVLQQLLGALQRQSFPLGTARIVTAATPPLAKTFPKTSAIMPLSIIGGLLAGFSIAAWREGMNRSLGTGMRLRRELGIATLGRIPLCKPKLARWTSRKKAVELRRIAMLRSVIDAPYEIFAESLRDLKSSIDATNNTDSSLTVGITSMSAGEGKTTIAINLAQLYINEGVDAVVIDADFISETLSKIMELHSDACALRSVEDEESLALPIVPLTALKNAEGSDRQYQHLPRLKAKLEVLREEYQVVIVDMSSFSQSADARAISAMVDGVIIVIGDARKTTIEAFSSALTHFGQAQINILGIALNRYIAEHNQSSRHGLGGNKSWPY